MKKNKGIFLIMVVALMMVLAVNVASAKDYVIGEHKVPIEKGDPAATFVGSTTCKALPKNNIANFIM